MTGINLEKEHLLIIIPYFQKNSIDLVRLRLHRLFIRHKIRRAEFYLEGTLRVALQEGWNLPFHIREMLEMFHQVFEK